MNPDVKAATAPLRPGLARTPGGLVVPASAVETVAESEHPLAPALNRAQRRAAWKDAKRKLRASQRTAIKTRLRLEAAAKEGVRGAVSV